MANGNVKEESILTSHLRPLGNFNGHPVSHTILFFKMMVENYYQTVLFLNCDPVTDLYHVANGNVSGLFLLSKDILFRS